MILRLRGLFYNLESAFRRSFLSLSPDRSGETPEGCCWFVMLVDTDNVSGEGSGLGLALAPYQGSSETLR